MIARIIALFRRPDDRVDDFRDVIDDLWANREARKAAETRRAIQFEMECDQ